jgi:hypothetical protein
MRENATSRDHISPQNARDENAKANDTNNQPGEHLEKDAISEVD